jgi:catechol 2,3-dioxygenase-like lactoylglutathione lyase family enzyme
MAKLRHIALSVKDLQESATFYEEAFGMERVRESDVADHVVRRHRLACLARPHEK